MQTLTTTALPQEEPVTLDEAKSHLRIDHNDEDALIRLWIKAAREYAEIHAGKRFVTQTITVKLDEWPCDGVIRLEGFGPGDLSTTGADTVITYIDQNGDTQTLSSANYQTDYTENPPIIVPEPFLVWPLTEIGRLKPISISVKAGRTQALVPAAIKAAILLTLTYWDENRGGEGAEAPNALGMPAGAKRLLDSQWTGAYA